MMFGFASRKHYDAMKADRDRWQDKYYEVRLLAREVHDNLIARTAEVVALTAELERWRPKRDAKGRFVDHAVMEEIAGRACSFIERGE